jgi:hypothetical protein
MALDQEALAYLTPPVRLDELGLREGLVEELFLRRVFYERLTTISGTADALAVSHAIGDQVAERLRQKSLLEYQGMVGRDYRIALTERGRVQASEAMQAGRHTASVPVPLVDYVTLVGLQTADTPVTRERARQVFQDLVLEDGFLDQVGPAFVGNGAIFLYGPSGTGKTSLAQRMIRFFDDAVLIPRFIEADGDLIAVFDPAIHKAVEQPQNLDPRYVLCQRPMVTVGGELTLASMELRIDERSGISTAPIQVQANNGMLLIDDFGRQAPSPDQILNRWIIPMSEGVDHLITGSGNKVRVPFELRLILSTNIDPNRLGDDAFLRRLRNKVFVGPCSSNAFRWMLARAATKYGIEVTRETAEYVMATTRSALGELRPYVAHDFCEMAYGICTYDGVPPNLAPRTVDRVAAAFFVRSTPPLDDAGSRGHNQAEHPAQHRLDRDWPAPLHSGS